MHLNLSSSLILEHRGVVARARTQEVVIRFGSQFRRGPPRKWLTPPMHTVAVSKDVFSPLGQHKY